MNVVPIVFAFDNKLTLPACVCISSLLTNAKKDTFYDIFILHSRSVKLDIVQLNKLPMFYKNCRIQYRQIDDVFDKSFEIRGITTATYYRLLIPEIIPEYEKIIYADVDIIFRLDLSSVFSIDLGDNYIAATRELGMNCGEDGKRHIHSMPQLSEGHYIQAGFIIMNNKAILKDNLISEFKLLAKRKFKFQDQDILNIACQNKISDISLEYNMTDYSFYYSVRAREMIWRWYDNDKIDYALKTGNIHYNGHKPWLKYSVNFDIWWEYYRKSPFYDDKFYFDFFYNRLNELDQLSLWKRIKILCRYFIYGKRSV